jgi:hypothetical protein
MAFQEMDVFRYKQNDITDFWVPKTMSKLYSIEHFFAKVGVSVSKSEKCTLRNMWRTDLEVAELTEQTIDPLIS